MKLTQAFVRRAVCKEGKAKQEFYDDTLKGFILEVKANKRKTFFLRYTSTQKKIKYIRIGDATIIPVEEARTKALKLKRSFEQGKEVTLTPKEIKQQIPTLQEFYKEYYLPYVQKHIKSWTHNDSMYRTHILPLFGNKKMTEIKKHEIMKIHTEMITNKHKKPSTANKLLIFLSQAFTIAQELELEWMKDNPAKRVKPFIENNECQTFLTKRQTKKLLEAVNQSKNPHLKYIVPMLILTGARRGEVLRAKWKDVDLEMNLWTIPISKNGKKRIIPISIHFKELLQTIPNTSQYLFPSKHTGEPQNNIYHSWDYARKRAGLKNIRMHDLRHSFASILVNSGRSLYEVQMLLGHANMKMTQRYAHLNNESLMKAASCAGRLF